MANPIRRGTGFGLKMTHVQGRVEGCQDYNPLISFGYNWQPAGRQHIGKIGFSGDLVGDPGIEPGVRLREGVTVPCHTLRPVAH